jgi:hypothetical protein
MKIITILLTALALTPSTATLKGAQRRSNLRQRLLHKSKTSTPTVSPSESPTLSPTECTGKGCDKEDKEDTSEDSVTYDEIIIEFDDAVSPSPQATLAPTFTDLIETPSPTFISDETGEVESNNGIGIGVDVGGDNNIVDVTVIITQNGGDVNAGGGGDDSVAEDDLLDDYIYEDGDGSMSTSMSMGSDDGTYGTYEETEEADEVMEKPEDVADIEADDDFSTFFDNTKKDVEHEGDVKGI